MWEADRDDSAGALAARLVAVAARIRQARQTEEERRAGVVRAAAVRLAGALQIECDQLRSQLEAVVREALAEGVIPSLLQVAGLSRLERPYNALLAWWVDADAEHGLGREFLMGMGEAIGFDRLVDDLARGDDPEIVAEQAPDAAVSSRQPDLMVGTRNAALLIENKVNSPESGAGQYADYLRLLEAWAGRREARAVLLARDRREAPNGYDHMMTHGELAEVFTGLADAPERGSRWGRICAAIMAATLDDTETSREVEWHVRARRLCASPPPSVGTRVLEMRTLAATMPRALRPTRTPKRGKY